MEFNRIPPAIDFIKSNKLLELDRHVIIGRTGDVYDAKNGEWIGSLTDPSLGR